MQANPQVDFRRIRQIYDVIEKRVSSCKSEFYM